MDITIKRTYHKARYIIGDLFINGEHYCNTLEPSETRYPFPCIPKGTYEVKMCISAKFHDKRPFILNVPKRIGIMIHEGNTLDDTHGCILVGENLTVGHVLNSKFNLKPIMAMIRKAELCGERVFCTIQN